MRTLVREDLSETPLSILEERRGVAQKDDAPDPDIDEGIAITTYGCYSKRVHTLFISNILFLTPDVFTEADKDGDKKEPRNVGPELIIQDAFHSICGGQNSCKVEYIDPFYRLYVPDIETAKRIAQRIESGVFNDFDCDAEGGYLEESKVSLLETILEHPLLITSAFLLAACVVAFFGYVA